jgi:UDP-glucose 4-epimerase
MRVAVTGGCGFIGSHVVDVLVEKGYEVKVLDNLSTGSLANLNPGAELLSADIRDRTETDTFFRKAKPEAVVHLAAQIDVQTSMAMPAFDARTNIMGTIDLLDICKRHDVGRFIYSSSAAIYGNPEYLGVDESHPTNPESYYGYSKLVPEKYIRMAGDDSGMTYAILRYANVYGPRQKSEGEGGVVAIFSNRMGNNEKCVIYGDGGQTRDFVYVKDVARANLLALENGESFTANVSTAKPLTVNELFAIMADKFGYDQKPGYRQARKGDILHSWLTNGEIHDRLGWEPVYSLEDGIGEMAGNGSV